MISRTITTALRIALSDTPVVFLAGARQTGKSTLSTSIAEEVLNAVYYTLDDYTTLNAARRNPDGFIAGLPEHAVIDEVQHAPELLQAIKAAVDRRRTPGRFLLTGSANILVLPKVSESLAGRIDIQTLWPLSQGEIAGVQENFIDTVMTREVLPQTGKSITEQELWRVITAGGYPEALTRTNVQRRIAWFDNYVSTILQRDIRELANIEALSSIPNILQLMASRCANLVNFADQSRSLGIPQTTLKRYVTLLESTFLLYRLKPWSANLGHRLTKTPKMYLNDTGLISSLLGIDEHRIALDGRIAGQLLENFVVNELTKQITWSTSRPNMYHFRTHAGQEVDIVLEARDGTCVGIEVKAATGIDSNDVKGLRLFSESLGERFKRGFVLYPGNTTIPFEKNLHALPISALWTRTEMEDRGRK